MGKHNMEYPTDTDLIRAVKEGDIASFETLVRRYEKRLLAFAISLTKRRETAEEIVQDTLFSFYRHIDRIDASRPFLPYVFTMMRNAVVSRFRSEKKTVPIHTFDIAGNDDDFIDVLQRQDMKKNVSQALAKLDQRYRKALTLYYFHEMSYDDIAKHLHIPVNTVRTYMRRGKFALKQILTI